MVKAETATDSKPNPSALTGPPDLAKERDILTLFSETLEKRGVVVQDAPAKILFLACVSRLLDYPVNVVVKGESGAGKSFLVGNVLRFFPNEAFRSLSSASSQSLAYLGRDELKNKILYIAEADGLDGEAEYNLRTLMSEGRISRQTVISTRSGELRPLTLEVEGPTAVLLTTTRHDLHPENETRLLSLPLKTTPEQMTEIFVANLGGRPRFPGDLTPWHDLQRWLEGVRRPVWIPYANDLGRLIPPVALRQQRDTKLLRSLIEAHAMLYQLNRPTHPDDDAIVATLHDYAVVRTLLADLLAYEVQAAVLPEVRKVVEAVRAIRRNEPYKQITLTVLSGAVQMSKPTVSRWVTKAEEAGYLINHEWRDGMPANLDIGEPMPDADLDVLPTVEDLAERYKASGLYDLFERG